MGVVQRAFRVLYVEPPPPLVESAKAQGFALYKHIVSNQNLGYAPHSLRIL